MAEIPSDLLARIRDAFLEYRYTLRFHGHERMEQRNIAPLEIREVVLYGEAIEYDAAGQRGTDAGILFFARVSQNRPLHVKVIEAQNIRTRVWHFVVTVYEPDLNFWNEDLKVRRSK
jgi:hypothetical protein